MEMNFCRRCGAKLTSKPNGSYLCKKGHTLFANASPAGGVFFINDNQEVLLSVRAIDPYKGMLDSPGGFVDMNESFEQAVTREIHEELGLTPNHYEPLQFLCSAPSIYPYEGEDCAVLGVFFWSQLHPDAKPIPADDVASIIFAPIATVDLSQIGNQDVRYALIQLKQRFLKP